MPGARGHRRDLALERGQLVEVGLDRRPDVTHTWLVSRRAPGRAPRRARRTASRQLARARSTCGSAVTCPSRRGRRRAGAPGRARRAAGPAGCPRRRQWKRQDVLRRLEPGEVEVAQPPQVEPAPDHRVHAADRPVLGHGAPSRRPEREVADLARRRARRPRRPGAPGPRTASGPGAVARGSAPPRRVGQVRPVQVEVDHGSWPAGPLGDDRRERRAGAVGRQLVERADRADEVRVALVEALLGDRERPGRRRSLLVQVGQSGTRGSGA